MFFNYTNNPRYYQKWYPIMLINNLHRYTICIYIYSHMIEIQYNPQKIDNIYIYIYPLWSNIISNIQYMEVSWNGGTPKSSIFVGFCIVKHPCWGTPIYGKSHTRWCPLLVTSWLIIGLAIDITTTSPSEIRVLNQLGYLGGITL